MNLLKTTVIFFCLVPILLLMGTSILSREAILSIQLPEKNRLFWVSLHDSLQRSFVNLYFTITLQKIKVCMLKKALMWGVHKNIENILNKSCNASSFVLFYFFLYLSTFFPVPGHEQQTCVSSSPRLFRF